MFRNIHNYAMPQPRVGKLTFNISICRLQDASSLTYLASADDVSLSAQHVNHFALALIAPLRTEDDGDFLIVVGNRATSITVAYQATVCVVHFVECTV